ncbi:hypothetical protein RSAG8_05385, partial [Rhizoctonia solani AG-8 WAC10335]
MCVTYRSKQFTSQASCSLKFEYHHDGTAKYMHHLSAYQSPLLHKHLPLHPQSVN